jgi:hypothetical protein
MQDPEIGNGKKECSALLHAHSSKVEADTVGASSWRNGCLLIFPYLSELAAQVAQPLKHL